MLGKNINLKITKNANYHVLTPSRQELDISNESAVMTYLSKNMPDLILHLAAKVGGIHANILSPYDFLDVNLQMGLNLIRCSVKLGIKKILNIGSSCMYPKDINTQLTEDLILTDSLEPTNEGYALAKIAILKLCQYASELDSNLNYKTVIPCNLYGVYDNFREDSSHLVASIIYKLHKACSEKVGSVEVWGDGNARREFMYAGDCADMLVKLIDRFDDVPDVMNLGTGLDYSVNDYYEIAASIIGYEGLLAHDLSRPVGMKRKLLNIDRQKELGLSSCTSIYDGISLAYSYYLSTINQ